MRLIDADSLHSKLFEFGCHKSKLHPLDVMKMIEEDPTAYDIDKVVEELEKAKTINVDVGFGTIYKTIRKDVALEIVKQGGVADDVCEWISVSDGEFIQNPHTKRLYSNEPSMNNVYCNSCGKKIKVVK